MPLHDGLEPGHSGDPLTDAAFDENEQELLHYGMAGTNYTAIGRMGDLAKYNQYENVDTWAKSGRMPGPGDPQVTWPENQGWIDDRVDRGDDFLLGTDRATLDTKYNWDGSGGNGFFTYREIQHLNSRGKPIIDDF